MKNRILNMEAEKAAKTLRISKAVRKYGDYGFGHSFHIWDSGYRNLICAGNGELFLHQCSEYHGWEDDDCYDDWFPVESEEQAEELNRRYDGFELEREFPGKWLAGTNGRYFWKGEAEK